MTWVLFDYGNVICQPQPERDVARLAEVAGCTVPELLTPYWAYRLDYDRAALDVTSYWQQVAADLGGSFTGPQIAELSEVDAGSWLHLRPASVDLVAGLAAARVRLAVLSNAPEDTAQAVAGLPVAAHFEHLIFSCYLKLAKPDPECFRAALAVLRAGRRRHLPRRPPGQRGRGGRPGHPEYPLHRRRDGPGRPGPFRGARAVRVLRPD